MQWLAGLLSERDVQYSKAEHEYGWERIARYSTASQAQLRPSVVASALCFRVAFRTPVTFFGTASGTVRAGKNNATIYWYSVIATAITYCTVDNNGSMTWARSWGDVSVVDVGTFSSANSHLASSGENHSERQVRNFGLGIRRPSFWTSLPPHLVQDFGRACGTISFGA